MYKKDLTSEEYDENKILTRVQLSVNMYILLNLGELYFFVVLCAYASKPFGSSMKKDYSLKLSFFMEAFLRNIKSLTLMKLPSAMKYACGTLRNALLHKFAKRIYFMTAKTSLHICGANASLKLYGI